MSDIFACMIKSTQMIADLLTAGGPGSGPQGGGAAKQSMSERLAKLRDQSYSNSISEQTKNLSKGIKTSAEIVNQTMDYLNSLPSDPVVELLKQKIGGEK